MNLGDGLLFELENGKPRLILLSHGVEKNPAKLPGRPRVSNILSSRQPTCVEEVQKEEGPATRQLAGRQRAAQGDKSRTGGVAITSNTAITAGKSTTGSAVRALPKLKPERQKHVTATGAPRANGRAGRPQSSGARAGAKKKETPAKDCTGLKEGLVCLTSEQLQKILNTVQTTRNDQNSTEEHKRQDNQTGSTSRSSAKDGGGKITEEHEEGEKKKREDREGETGTPGCSQDKASRSSGCLFSWMDERQSESRAANDAKKAQWRRELDEQVALKQQKQQRSAPSRLQVEEDRDSLLSVQTSISYREQPAAIRSSLKLGEVTPGEEALSMDRKEEQRRHWLEELDRQREETIERRRREKLLQSQTEDHELWATHFDSLQRKPPLLHPAAPSAPPPAPSNISDRGEWEPSSSLSLAWEAMSSCGAESLGGVSVDTTNVYQTRTSHLRTMTALLDPAQIEERERRRLNQLEQQRDIEAQMAERRRQREQEEARRREEEEEEERRVRMERERLERQYELDAQRERQKSSHQAEQQEERPEEQRHQQETSGHQHDVCLEKEISISVLPCKDTAVQTEEPSSLSLQTPDVSTHHQLPPALSAAPLNSRSRAGRAGKENICVQAEKRGGGGGEGVDLYEAYARTDRSRKDKRRPEWNTQRPSRRFVPASERYPASLQKHRQESRLKRQAELLALQERTCLSRTEPPPPPLTQDLRLLPNLQLTRTSSRNVEALSGVPCSDRGRSVQSQQAGHSSTSPPPLEFVPYVRTDEVFNLNPLEPADTPPPQTHKEAPPQRAASPPAPPLDPLLHPELRRSHTHRQQEILRGLAQLRQGLLQKQRELETDHNPALKRHNNEPRTSSASHRM